jgi:hypothetical protein
VALLVFWLALLFASFGLFAPQNFVSLATLALCAVAVAGAIGMVLELEKGYASGCCSAAIRIEWICISGRTSCITSRG